MWTAFLAILSLLVLTGPGFAQQAESEIKKANARFEQAFAAGDTAAIAQMYTEQAAVLPPESEMVQGRDAIRAFWQAAIDSGLRNLTLSAVRVDELGDQAAREIGRFTLDAPGKDGKATPVDGKYVVLWRKTGEDWKIDTDIWNTSTPASPAVASEGQAAPAAGSGAAR